MRKVIVTMFTSLDGVVQAPGGPGEDDSGGFTLGGWSVNYWDDMMGAVGGEFMAAPFDLLLGRGTFEIFAAHWPRIPADETAQKFTAANKYVATHRPIESDWANVVPLGADVPSAIKLLKAGEGIEMQVHGSPGLAQTLQEHNLVDEYRIWTFPVLLGQGKRLFEGNTLPAGLVLQSSRTSTTGVNISAYTLAGGVTTGSFMLDSYIDPDPELRET